jgi:hypothetical protein
MKLYTSSLTIYPTRAALKTGVIIKIFFEDKFIELEPHQPHVTRPTAKLVDGNNPEQAPLTS